MSALRLVTAAIAFGLIALAFYDDRFVGGGPGFGVSQAFLLALGVAIGAFCVAPPVWNARVLTLLVSVALTLGTAELVLRSALGPRYYTSMQLDPRLLYRPSPGSRREYTRAAINGGVRVRYAMNSQGYRGDELFASGESVRVVVYGDSFIMAEFSRSEDTFAERLEVHLAQALRERVEVVNAGVAGYGPDQELRRMEAELGALRPDLVLVAIYAGNDFGDIVRNKLYRLTDDGGLRENRFSFDPAIERRVAVSRSELILKKVLRDTLGRISGAARASVATGRDARIERVERSLEQLMREHHEYVVLGDDVVHELLSDPYNADVSLSPESDSARYRVALMEQVIVRMRATTDALRLPLLLLLIPSPIDVTDDHESGLVDAQAHPSYRRTALTDALEQICQRHRIPALNLFAPFAAGGGSQLYLKGVDDHWNEAGQDLAAKLASEAVVAQSLVRARMEARP